MDTLASSTVAIYSGHVLKKWHLEAKLDVKPAYADADHDYRQMGMPPALHHIP
jgi:hypothetical protein